MNTVVAIALAQKELEAIEAELAEVRLRIAPFRRVLYAARESVRDQCIESDQSRMTITSWRAPNCSEVAELDAAAAWFVEATEHMIPDENRLKAALGEAKKDLSKAKFAVERAVRDATRKVADSAQSDLF